jgi:DNA modification methylase
VSDYRLICGDCLALLPTLEAGSVDAIITDLPYGGTTACNWDEVIPFTPMWEQVKRVLRPRGVFVTTAAQPFTSLLVASNIKLFRHDLVWDKLSAVSPLNSLIAPKRSHESIIVFGQPGHTYNPQMWDAGKPNSKRGKSPRTLAVGRHETYDETSRKAKPNDRYPVSIIRIPFGAGECNSALRVHPTQKPVALMAYLIRTYTNVGDTVLDFCMGSGTTGVAAIKEGRRFVGMELDSGYFAIAQKRLEDAAAQPFLIPAGMW